MTKEQLLNLLEGYEDDEEIDLYELNRLIQEQAEEHERWLEEREEREEEQHASGFYAFQDTLDMYRRER